MSEAIWSTELAAMTAALDKTVLLVPEAEAATAALGAAYSSTVVRLRQALQQNTFAWLAAPVQAPNSLTLHAASRAFVDIHASLQQARRVCSSLKAAHVAAAEGNTQVANTGTKPASAHQQVANAREKQEASDAQVAAAIAAQDKDEAESAADAQPSTSTHGNLEWQVQLLRQQIIAMEAAKAEADSLLAETVGAKEDAADRLAVAAAALASESVAVVSYCHGSWCNVLVQHLALSHAYHTMWIGPDVSRNLALLRRSTKMRRKKCCCSILETLPAV